jgi:hypothetical protein
MKVYNLLIALMLSMSLFSSCACEEDTATDDSAVIKLSLGTVATKTNAALPTDNGSTIGTNEGKVNTVCVGIFDSSNNLITLHEYTYSGDESITTNTKATQMVVVANVPAGQFTGVTTRSGFLAKMQSLAYTTSANGLTNTNKSTAGSQTLTALPMYAETTLSSLSGTSITTQSLSLSRIVARVAITSIATNFGSTVAFAGATFVPKEIFMYNVNDKYQWSGTASSSATNLSGEITSGAAGSLVASSSSSTAYLSSGLLSMTGVAGSSTYLSTSSNPYFFYVFPHSSTSPTKLVIKGIYYPKGGSEATGEVMYYPIIINHLQTGTTITDTGGTSYADGATYSNDSQLAANTTYKLAVTINNRGVTDVTQDITPSSATVTMTVASWTPITYTNSFTSKKAYIGNYYYNDGSWGTVASPTDGRTTIGIVFSTTTSTTDQANGWTHGYAMALTNAATSVSWSSTANKGIADMGGLYMNNVSLMEGDMDGYSHSKTIQNKEITSNLLSSFSTDYPAFYYALNYGTSTIGGTKYAAPIATNNSGWFLPSMGQWYLIVKNLGGITTVVDFDTGSPGYGGWRSPAALTASTGINSYLNTVSGSTSIDWSLNNGRWFWSSTQWSSQFACNMCINYNEELGLNYFNKDTSTYSSGSISALFLVRPIIAF